MKHLLSIIILACLPMSAMGQSSVAGSQSGSAAEALAASEAAALAALNVTNNYNSSGKSTIKTAPSVQAPSVFGGGHPCLAGKSGGLSILGGGASYGEGEAEAACMLWLMNQPEAALRVVASSSKEACRAMNDVGYIRVGQEIIPFECTVRHPIRTVVKHETVARSQTVNSQRAQSPPALFKNGGCRIKDDGRVGIKYTAAGRRNKDAANRACVEYLNL